MQKVLVIGAGGAGKTTFARRLGERLRIEVLHLDSFYWNPGWVRTPKDEWSNTVEQLLERESWIMDGNYSNTLDLRLKACDTAIFLDLPRTVCLRRVLKRSLLYLNRNRPDMATGCREKLDLEFLLWVWNYPKRVRPKVLELLREHAADKMVIRLRSQAEVETFLNRV